MAVVANITSVTTRFAEPQFDSKADQRTLMTQRLASSLCSSLWQFDPSFRSYTTRRGTATLPGILDGKRSNLKRQVCVFPYGACRMN